MQSNQSRHHCRRKINEGRMRLSARIFGKWHIQPLDISIEPLTWQLLNQFFHRVLHTFHQYIIPDSLI